MISRLTPDLPKQMKCVLTSPLPFSRYIIIAAFRFRFVSTAYSPPYPPLQVFTFSVY